MEPQVSEDMSLGILASEQMRFKAAGAAVEREMLGSDHWSYEPSTVNRMERLSAG
jgi:hypothetical protein